MDPAKIMSFSCPHDQTFTYYLDDRASIQATVVSTLVAIPATIIFIFKRVTDRCSD